MSATIYARIDPDLKAAVDEYAKEEGKSLASTVGELVSRGLEGASNERSVRELESRCKELSLELSKVREATSAVQRRIQQVLAKCPTCGQELTGNDLLISGSCPGCNHGVSTLLSGSNEGAANRDEIVPFLAGVGVALAVILLANSSGS